MIDNKIKHLNQAGQSYLGDSHDIHPVENYIPVQVHILKSNGERRRMKPFL